MDKNIIFEDLSEIYSRAVPWELLKNSTVLITGAYGMLASYMMYMLIYLNEYANMNIHIIAVVRSKEKFEKRFGKYADRDYIAVCTDSLDTELNFEGNIDYIIHAASLASPQYYGVCPIEVLKPNVIGNYNLLNLAFQKKVRGYLLFSTGDIYGRISGIKSVSETDYGILDPLDIHSCYGESKRMAETMCAAYYHQKNVPVKIARIFHTYSPTVDVDNDPRVFSSFVKDIINNNDIIIKSDGKAKRCFCYIADAVAAYFLILLKGENAQAYNVCNTEEFYSIYELANALVNIYPERGLNVIFEKRRKDESYMENKAANFIPPDDAKLKALGWRAVYDINSGFRRVIDYLENE